MSSPAVKVRPRKKRRGSKQNGKSDLPVKQRHLESAKVEVSKKNGSGEASTPRWQSQLGKTHVVQDSTAEGARLFESLISPVTPDKFFKEVWEKKPLLVKRHSPRYNESWFSCAELDKILRQEHVNFGEHLDVVSYRDDQRETHNPHGRAYAPVVWDFFQNGCSLRMLNPATYSRNVWKYLAMLQDFFNSCMGANIYLTPPGTQGFAPHYDDIEAFVIQLEGKKHWKVYQPRSESEELPLYSSRNLSKDNLPEPIIDTVLEAGDLLYFPRGFIHQGKALEDAHSLHVTMSTAQLNTWGHLLKKMLPRAIDIAMEEDVRLRRSLPRDYPAYMGVAFQDLESKKRQRFAARVEELMKKVVSVAPVDAACDQMTLTLLHDALPPALSAAERRLSIHGSGERWEGGRVRGSGEVEPDTEVKLLRRGILRLVTEGESVRVYHSMENARLYHKVDPQYLDISPEMAPGVEHLIRQYPAFCLVDSLPLDDVTDRVDIASLLYDKGLLMTRTTLESSDEEEDEEV